jgi:hypothetical protein
MSHDIFWKLPEDEAPDSHFGCDFTLVMLIIDS